eukprot:1058018-Pelagomonas_calceolata.AAC.4
MASPVAECMVTASSPCTSCCTCGRAQQHMVLSACTSCLAWGRAQQHTVLSTCMSCLTCGRAQQHMIRISAMPLGRCPAHPHLWSAPFYHITQAPSKTKNMPFASEGPLTSHALSWAAINQTVHSARLLY